ncbi:MAG: hypothetical protein O9255_06140 [Silanimonas sp.]|nr:hypothetical protein [Silanimonas sp.]
MANLLCVQRHTALVEPLEDLKPDLRITSSRDNKATQGSVVEDPLLTISQVLKALSIQRRQRLQALQRKSVFLKMVQRREALLAVNNDFRLVIVFGEEEIRDGNV